jgi:hypothetical protein
MRSTSSQSGRKKALIPLKYPKSGRSGYLLLLGQRLQIKLTWPEKCMLEIESACLMKLKGTRM